MAEEGARLGLLAEVKKGSKGLVGTSRRQVGKR